MIQDAARNCLGPAFRSKKEIETSTVNYTNLDVAGVQKFTNDNSYFADKTELQQTI